MFTKATKQKLKLRMGLFAPSGGGKTWTSLLFAGAIGQRIAYIDTENNSSAKYIGEPGIPEFDIAGLPYQADAGKYIRRMMDLIGYAQDHYDVIVVDSLTHAWSACKDEVDAVAKRMRNPNSFAAWKEGSTLWGQLISCILNCRTHIICCARSKTDWVQEKDPKTGKTVPRKIGMAPELRDGMEYELDLVAEMDQEHNLMVTKTRCHAVDGRVAKCPGPDWMQPVLSWLNAGVEAPSPVPHEAGHDGGATDDGAPHQQTVEAAYAWAVKLHRAKGADALAAICDEFAIPNPPTKEVISDKMTEDTAIVLAERCRLECVA